MNLLGQYVDNTVITDQDAAPACSFEDEERPADLKHKNLIVIKNSVPQAPNISLNLSNHHKRTPVWVAAIFGIVLQLSVLAFFAVITYHPTIRVDFKRDNSPIPEYACPLAAGGIVLVGAGMFLCAHVVESSTRETRYTVNGNGSHRMRLFWIQQEKTVSDQVFQSFALHPASDTVSFIESHRVEDVSKKTIRGALQAKTTFGVAIGITGFVCQFVGLRQMNSTASLAQLIAVCIMTAVRAIVRRGFGGSLISHKLLSGCELDWFAWSLLRMGPSEEQRLTTRSNSDTQTQNGAAKRHKPPGWWTIDHLWTDQPERFQTVSESTLNGKTPQKTPFHEIPLQKAPVEEMTRNLARVRRRLGRFTDYKARESKISLSLAAAMEKTLNVLSACGEQRIPDFIWLIGVHCDKLPPSESEFQLKLHYNSDLGSWKVRADDLDAALTLWAYTIRALKKGDTASRNLRSLEQTKADDDDHWFRSETHPRSVRLLGPTHNSASVAQDIKWWAFKAWYTTLKVLDDKNLITVSTGVSEQPGSVRLQHDGRILNWQERRELEHVLKPANAVFKSDDVPTRHHWAVRGHDSLKLRCAKELLFSFVCSTARSLRRPLTGKVHVQITEASSTDSTLLFTNSHLHHFENDDLSGLVSDLVQLGFGFEDEASLTVFLPLSVWDRLPLPWTTFDSICAKITESRRRQDWTKVWVLINHMTVLWLQGSRQGLFSQHGFVFLVESIHELESRVWLAKIEGRERDEETKTIRRCLSSLVADLEKFLDYKRLLDELEILYSHFDRNTHLLAHLKRGRGGPAWSDQEEHNGYSTEDFAGKETMKPGSKRDGASVTSTAPRWLGVPLQWQPWHIRSRASPLRSRLSSELVVSLPDYLGITPLHLGQFILPPNETWGTYFPSNPSEDPHARDMNGSTPLHYAAAFGEFDLAHFVLIGEGVDPRAPNIWGYTPAHYTFAHGNRELIDLLRIVGADFECQGLDGAYPIHLAAASGNSDFVQFLRKEVKPLDWLAKDFDRRCAIHWATIGGHRDVVIQLDDMMNEQDIHGWTALHLAVLHQKPHIIDVLCSMGADEEVEDNKKRTPLRLACYGRNHEAVLRFVKTGAKFDNLVLHMAAQCYETQDLEALNDALVYSGKGWLFDVAFPECGGNTMLHIAVASLNLDAVRMFMERGADPTKHNDKGLTPTDLVPKVGMLSPQIEIALQQKQDVPRSNACRKWPL